MNRVCGSRGHDLAEVGLTPDGRCRECKREASRRTEQRTERKRRDRKPRAIDLNWVMERVAVSPSGCWIWQLTRKRDGYGSCGSTSAHRVVYEALVGSIEADLTLDHMCHTPTCQEGESCPHRACVNPQHMEQRSRTENSVRTGNSQKTHCRYGHAYTDENTNRRRDGRRYCRSCHLSRQRARAAARRESVAA